MLLKVLAIVLGALVVVTRGYGFLFTESARKLIRGMVERKVLMLVAALVGALLGAVIAGAARVALQEQVLWQAIVLLVLGILITLAGLLFLAVPKAYARLVEKFLGMKTMALRLLFLLGVIFGVLLILLGVSMP